MKEVIRVSTFETNSSSTHAFAFRKKEAEDYQKCTERLRKLEDNFDKLLVVIGAAEMFADDAKHAFVFWVEENCDKGTDVRSFAKKLFDLNDKAKMADYLRNSKEINKTAYDDYKWFVNDKTDVYDAFVNSYLIAEYFRYMHYIDVAIKTYADNLGLNEEVLKEKITEIKSKSREYICRALFDEGPLSDCDCRIDEIFDNVENEHDIETLMNDLMSDKLSVFCCESFLSYISINSILNDTEDEL